MKNKCIGDVIIMISLKKMHYSDYNNYIEIAIPDYANDKIESGAWKEEEAFNLSEQTFFTSLPNKQDTINEYLYCICLEKQVIGYTWFHFNSKDNSTAFIYDFLILEDYQNKGYGSKAMFLIQNNAKKVGAKKIALHVFAHNERAVHVYKNNGFHFTDFSMAKEL